MSADEQGDADSQTQSALQSWSAVLADVEADVARTGRLLATATTADGQSSVGAPAEAMLPAGSLRHPVDVAGPDSRIAGRD
jgi:hypothetical protein